jgi:uncharacterized membrane protein
MTFEGIASWVAKSVEAVGMLVMVVGMAVSIGRYLVRLKTPTAFQDVRRGVGHAILLGLELLVAADIIHTISTEITIESVATLGGIVVIRTFLGFSLTMELEGRVPWRRATVEPAKVSSAGA